MKPLPEGKAGMTCADLETLLCDYVDGTLAGDQRAAVERHLAGCAACAELARDAAAVVAFIERVPPVEPPDELMTRLLFQIPSSGAAAHRRRGGLRALLGRWVQPILQPRFAMGMAMTILSFSLLGKFAGIPDRPLRPSDLDPVKVWATLDDRFHRAWDRAVKYYENLRLVYEIRARLREWAEQEELDRNQPGGSAPGVAAEQPSSDARQPRATPGERRQFE